ncbi:MAG TPA: LysE family transporter [Candidatus Bathyarchaeia archaeon]|nr:LysE family transporter [Candidatus Bathyarchaeia archaeon]
MELIPNFGLFLASVVLISMSGVLLPGPLFAVTIEKASKRKTAGALIALGHGVIEFPLMFLIFFVLSQFVVPDSVRSAIGLVGGALMIYMGAQAFRNRNKEEKAQANSKRGSLFAGIWTTAANAGFILWWLTVGTALILNAQLFGLLGFSVFAGVHWLCDFVWYTIIAFAIFKSRRFWTKRVHEGISLFCVVVFVGFGAYFFGSALWTAISLLM